MSLLVLPLPAATKLPAPANSLEAGYDDMYNLQFADAHKFFQVWEKTHPQDPLGPVSDAAAYIFSEFDRLHILQSEFFLDDKSFSTKQALTADPAAEAHMEADLQKSQQLADAILKQSPDDTAALLATVMRFGLHADYEALVQKHSLLSLNYVKQGRTVAEHLLTVHPDCYDAYVAIGVENYLLSQKAAPLRWLLRAGGAQTDKDTGIKNLEIAASKGDLLKPYAQLLLAVAALRDKDQPRAKRLLSDLSLHFPGNVLYREELRKLS